MKRYITVATVLSAFAVVGLHVNNFWTFRYSNDWVMANFTECLFYFAVPVFFMITGVTLIDYKEKYSTKTYFKKRFTKILIPLISWNVIACIVQKMLFHIDFNIFSLNSWCDAIVNSRFIEFYWFFNSILIVYFVIPVLSDLNNKVKIFIYCIFLYFILSVILPIIFNYNNIPYNGNLYFQIGTGFSVYSMIGYVIDKTNFTRKQEIIIYILGITGFCIHFFGTWYLSYQDGEINRLFKEYLNLPCLFYSVSIFLFVKQVISPKITNYYFRIIYSFSSLTFGIYLVQWFVREFLQNIWKELYMSFFTRTFGSILVFLISSLIVFFMKKIPIVKKIVP